MVGAIMRSLSRTFKILFCSVFCLMVAKSFNIGLSLLSGISHPSLISGSSQNPGNKEWRVIPIQFRYIWPWATVLTAFFTIFSPIPCRQMGVSSVLWSFSIPSFKFLVLFSNSPAPPFPSPLDVSS